MDYTDNSQSRLCPLWRQGWSWGNRKLVQTAGGSFSVTYREIGTWSFLIHHFVLDAGMFLQSNFVSVDLINTFN